MHKVFGEKANKKYLEKKQTKSINYSKMFEKEKKQACCAGCRSRPSPAEAPPIGKIHPFSKMGHNFWTTDGILMPFRIENDLDPYSLFYTWETYL